MSQVFSFRLSNKNLRESQASEVINVWLKKGYSMRYILTEALLCMGNQTDESHLNRNFIELDEKIFRILNLLEGNFENKQTIPHQKTELSSSFIASLTAIVKPGMSTNDYEQ